MSPDHPHAKALGQYYEAMAAVAHLDDDPAGRSAAIEEVATGIRGLLTPDFRIHTAGIRLAATGGLDFTMVMGQRRNALSGGTFRPLSDLSIIADDVYAVIRGVFGARRGDLVYRQEAMGTWRFDSEGRATEHWEQGPALRWDEFWIACDPDFEFTSGEQFWLKDARAA